MSTYRIVWSAAAWVIAVVGVMAAFLFMPLDGVVVLGMGAAIVGPAVSATIYPRAREHNAAVSPPTYLFMSRLLAAVGTIAFSGYLALSGATALLLLGLVIATSPVVLGRLPNHVGRAPAPDHEAAPTFPVPLAQAPSPAAQQLPCGALSVAELCWQWRTTFAAQQRALSPSIRLQLTEVRSALLDELARRDVVAFSRWMDNGARAASDPTPYFTGVHRRQLPDRCAPEAEQ